jgi:hypothetical protein
MKILAICVVTFFFCHSGGPASGQQERGTVESRLIQNLKEVIVTKCHLTKLSQGNAVLTSGGNIEVRIDFDNRTLKSFWTPEVAVQYIYDAALDPIMASIFKKSPDQSRQFNSIVFFVDISPHDIPTSLVFQIKRDDFLNYKEKPESKEIFFRQMNITTKGERFRFDAAKAALVE